MRVATKMNTCKECGAVFLRKTDKFCNQCGAPVENVIKEKNTKSINKKATKKALTYNEKKMAIYKMTSQDNCGECGCKNCMQFAMQAASPKNNMDINDCPYIDEDEVKRILNENKLMDESQQKASQKKTSVPKKTAVKKQVTKKSTPPATKKKRKCPSCGSTDIHKEQKKFRPGMLVFGVIGAVAEGIRSKQMQYVCDDCGHKWDV